MRGKKTYEQHCKTCQQYAGAQRLVLENPMNGEFTIIATATHPRIKTNIGGARIRVLGNGLDFYAAHCHGVSAYVQQAVDRKQNSLILKTSHNDEVGRAEHRNEVKALKGNNLHVADEHSRKTRVSKFLMKEVPEKALAEWMEHPSVNLAPKKNMLKVSMWLFQSFTSQDSFTATHTRIM